MGEDGPGDQPSIEDSITYDETFPSVTERYYTPRYYVDDKAGEDMCVLFHSNRICLLTLAPSHPIIKQKKTITKFDFQVTEHTNRLNNAVLGKRKKGAQQLQCDSIVCRIHCQDQEEDRVYTIRSYINGKLIEINEMLIKQPNLAVSAPQAAGYIAIILPKLDNSEKQKMKLLDKESYHNLLNQRQGIND